MVQTLYFCSQPSQKQKHLGGIISRHLHLRRQRSTNALASSEVLAHGLQVDIVVKNEDSSEPSDEHEDDGHHEDEIVDHLEVIGTFLLFSKLPFSLIYSSRSYGCHCFYTE